MALLRYCANAELCRALLDILMDKTSIPVSALLLRVQHWLATRIKTIFAAPKRIAFILQQQAFQQNIHSSSYVAGSLLTLAFLLDFFTTGKSIA